MLIVAVMVGHVGMTVMVSHGGSVAVMVGHGGSVAVMVGHVGSLAVMVGYCVVWL